MAGVRLWGVIDYARLYSIRRLTSRHIVLIFIPDMNEVMRSIYSFARGIQESFLDNPYAFITICIAVFIFILMFLSERDKSRKMR